MKLCFNRNPLVYKRDTCSERGSIRQLMAAALVYYSFAQGGDDCWGQSGSAPALLTQVEDSITLLSDEETTPPS